jgi:tetratricopeptide (TPR) repeat protein
MSYNETMGCTIGQAMGVALGIGILSTSGFAQTNFANCDSIGAEESQIKSPMPDSERLEVMRQLANDLQSLKDSLIKGHAQLPKSFLGTCYAKKRDVLNTHIEVAPGSVKSSAEFSKIMGQYSMLVGRPDRALSAFLEAIKRDPKDLNARYVAYNLWIGQEVEKILAQKDESHKKTLYENFIRDSDKIIEPVLRSPSAPIDSKIAIYMLRSEALLEGFKDLKAAAKDWREILKLNPKDTVVAKKYSDYALFKKDYAEAIPALGMLIEQNPKDLEAHLKLVRSLDAIKDYKSGLTFSKKASERFPKNAEIRSFYARCLSEQGLWQEAKIESAKAGRAEPNNANAKKAKSMVLEQQGDDYVKKQLVGPALQSFNEAYRLDAKRQSLREKMAALIFDERNKDPQDQSAAAVKDYAQVTKLLAPLIKDTQLGKEHCQILIFSALRASNAKLGARACDYHLQELGSLTNSDLVISCARLFKNNGRKDQAQELLSNAINDPMMASSKSDLNQALLNLVR